MKAAAAVAGILKQEGVECLFCFPINQVIVRPAGGQVSVADGPLRVQMSLRSAGHINSVVHVFVVMVVAASRSRWV